MPFVALTESGTAASSGLFDRLEMNSLARIALIGFFALALVFLVLRPLLRARSGAGGATSAILDSSTPTPALPGADKARGALSTAVAESVVTPVIEPEIDFMPQSPKAPDPVARLKELMRERQDESLKILTGWIEKREDAV